MRRSADDLAKFSPTFSFAKDCGQYEPDQQVADHLQLYRGNGCVSQFQTSCKMLQMGYLASCILRPSKAENGDEDSWNPALAFRICSESIDLVLFQDTISTSHSARMAHAVLLGSQYVGDGQNLN